MAKEIVEASVKVRLIYEGAGDRTDALRRVRDELAGLRGGVMYSYHFESTSARIKRQPKGEVMAKKKVMKKKATKKKGK